MNKKNGKTKHNDVAKPIIDSTKKNTNVIKSNDMEKHIVDVTKHGNTLDTSKKNIDEEIRFKNIIEDIPIDKHIKWYKDEYAKVLKVDDTIDISSGSMARMQNISMMKYTYSYNTMDMIVAVMKLYDYTTKKETNYGTLFCELINNFGKIKYQNFNSTIYGNVAFTFYSATPSFISCDGEYRAQFSKVASLINAKEEFSDLWNDLETYVIRIKNRRAWSPHVLYFYPKMEQANKNTEVEYAVRNELFGTTILVVTWFNTIYEELVGITKTHVNQTFKDIFLNEKETDINYLKFLINKYSEPVVELFRISISSTFGNFQGKRNYIQCGYKMIPLNIKEVQDPLKFKYKPWREYFISNKCNDLVVNGICPCFSIILDWFYIKNSQKGLFDNKSQFDKMKQSEIAKNILQTLYEAQRGTYFATENLEMINKTDEQIKQWIGTKFKKLSEKIDEPVNYCIEEIIMSEVTLAFVNEYVGRTVADTLDISFKSSTYNNMIGNPFKDSGYNYFAKYLFEICYGLLCINKHLNCIHGDFHLNNATIGALYFPHQSIKTKKDVIELIKNNDNDKDNSNYNMDLAHEVNKNKNSRITYKVKYNVSDDNYIFDNNGYFGCIIDFSRSIINPTEYELFVDKSLPPTYKLVSDEDKFISSEVNNLLYLYIQMFPNKAKQKEELLVLFKNQFEAVFKLLTCIDLYMFTIRLARLFKQGYDGRIGHKAVTLINKLNRLSETYISIEMNQLISDVNYSKKILEDKWPMQIIIEKCFPEFKSNDNTNVNDVYHLNNEVKYSLCKYELFPEIIKTAKYYEGDKSVEIEKVREMRENTRADYEREKINNLEMVNYIAMRHSRKLFT